MSVGFQTAFQAFLSAIGVQVSHKYFPYFKSSLLKFLHDRNFKLFLEKVELLKFREQFEIHDGFDFAFIVISRDIPRFLTDSGEVVKGEVCLFDIFHMYETVIGLFKRNSGDILPYDLDIEHGSKESCRLIINKNKLRMHTIQILALHQSPGH